MAFPPHTHTHWNIHMFPFMHPLNSFHCSHMSPIRTPDIWGVTVCRLPKLRGMNLSLFFSELSLFFSLTHPSSVFFWLSLFLFHWSRPWLSIAREGGQDRFVKSHHPSSSMVCQIRLLLNYLCGLFVALVTLGCQMLDNCFGVIRLGDSNLLVSWGQK